MSRFTGSTWKVSRRLGYSISETGKELSKRKYAPGQHGQKRSKQSEYAIQQQEKQRIRFTFGVSEKQFRKIFDKAASIPGKTGVNFLKLLECRLDNLVYRMGFAATRAQARQLVAHGHITVDGKKVDIPSYTVVVNQTIGVRESSKDLVVIKKALEAVVLRKEYLSFDETRLSGVLVRMPERDEFLTDINEQLVVEFYNR